MPPAVRALRWVLVVQAVGTAVSAVLAIVAYFIQGADHLGLGGYASVRMHPLSMSVLNTAAVAVLLWFARRLSGRPIGVRRQIQLLEAILLLDALVAFAFGVFTVWLVIGALAAVAVLWYLRTDEVGAYLL